MKWLLCILTLLASCTQVTDTPEILTNNDAQTNTVFGSYHIKPDATGGLGITLHSDSTYFYAFGSCLQSGQDSGKYKIVNDTIYFKSLLEDKADTSNHGHDQITPLTGEKYLIKNGRIYYWIENGKYDLTTFLLKQGLETTATEVFDSTGNGYAIFYNGDRQITKYGLFENFKLKDGRCYIYLADGRIGKIEIYKNGTKIKDSIPDK